MINGGAGLDLSRLSSEAVVAAALGRKPFPRAAVR